MNGVTMDSTKILTEKLSLSRELAILKPELEHLRSQATYQQSVLSEKLALERQVSTLEVELETEKRSSKRAMDKNKNKEKELELQQQLDDLQKELAKEKRDREKANKEAEKAIESERQALKRATEKINNTQKEDELQRKLDDLQAEYMREKREGEKLQKELERELESERRASKRAMEKNNASREKDLELEQQLDDLQTKLAQEKREKEKVRKEAEKELAASEIRKTVLESKLDQMRTKLRTMKSELQECQAELSQAHAAAVKSSTPMMKGKDAGLKNPRKRAALEMSADVAIGTPDGVAIRGQRPAVKRGRMEQSMLGEKSMFSITPFLNRTISLAMDSPAPRQIDQEAAFESVNIEAKAGDVPLDMASKEDQVLVEASPSGASKTKAKAKQVKKAPTEKKILGDSKQGANAKKPAAKKTKAMSTLEMVTEENGEENDDAAQVVNKISEKLKPVVTKPSKVQPKVAEEAEPKKKKRKLLGGGKTLFDEEDGEATKRPAKATLGPSKLLGKGGLAGPKGGLKGGLGAASGFGGFSPLKKDRRGAGASFLA